MSSFKKLMEDMDKDIAAESGGFPTKRNHAGNQQNYVPAGDEDGGKYTYDSATIKPGQGGGEEPSPKPKEEKAAQPKNDDAIEVKEGEGEKTDKDFSAYVDGQKWQTDFKDYLKKSHKTGSQEAKDTLDYFVKNGELRIAHSSSGRDCYSGGSTCELSIQGSSRLEGEVFWHEFYHGFDNKCFKLLPANKKAEFKAKSMWDISGFMDSQNVSTSYITSSGSTMFETLKKEVTNNKKNGVFKKMREDYEKDTIEKVISNFPDIDQNTYKTEKRELLNEISKQVNEEFAGTEYWKTANERWDRERELTKANPRLNRIKEFESAKFKAEGDQFKEWSGVSDMYSAAFQDHGFCGGHSASYWRKSGTQRKALEFLAEYGSAKATGDEKTIARFKQYFPETSKAAEDCIKAIHDSVRSKKNG